MRTTPGLRLAYELVERRYGAPPRDLFALEQASVEKGDLLGRGIWNEEAMDSQGFTEDDMTVTPFANYLDEMAREIDRPEAVRFHDSLPLDEQGLDIWGANPYAVCGGDLDEIAGNSAPARWALEWGDVRVSEIPENLMSDEAKARRAAWLESKLSEDVRARMERHEASREQIRSLLAEVEADRESE